MAQPEIEKKKGGRPPRGSEPCNCPVSGRVTPSNLIHLDLVATMRTRDEGKKVTRSQVLNDAVTRDREAFDKLHGLDKE
jgi:hypothetical protein